MGINVGDQIARSINRLNAVSLGKLGPGMHGDGGGLWLQVTPTGRSWIFRFTLNGRAREMGLFERYACSVAAFIRLAMIRIMLRRLTRSA